MVESVAVTVYGPGVDEFGNPAYTDKDVARMAISHRRLVDFRVGSVVYTVGRPGPDVASIDYGLFLCDGEARIAVFEYCAEQNATACEYGGWYTGLDRQGCRLIVYVGTRVVGGRERRFTAVLDEETNTYKVYDAPVALRLRLEDGRELVVGVGPGPLAVAAILAALGVVGGIVAWSVLNFSQASATWANTVREAARYCMEQNDTQCLMSVVAGASAVRDEFTAQGWLDQLVSVATAVPAVLAALPAILMLVMRLEIFRLIVDLIRGLRRRG